MKHTIITKDCSDYCIVIPASYAPVERTASLELQQYFKKVFGITVTVVLEGADGNNKEEILEAINALEAGGSTAGADGINTAYRIAEKYFISGGNNRIVLAFDK